MVMMNSKRRKASLSMAWIDYKKAFNIIPHSWLIESLEIYGAEENTIRLLKNTMPNWKTILTSSGTRLAEVNRDLPRRLAISTALHSSNGPNDKGPRENGGLVPTQEKRQQN